jgi:hypothetical protein
MLELVQRLMDDTLWIYTAILGSLFGAAFLAYFRDTHLGIWSYGKLDQILDYLVERWGWTWFKQSPDSWRNKYPYITKKIDELEQRIAAMEPDKCMKCGHDCHCESENCNNCVNDICGACECKESQNGT